jgi:endonuclease/exonuclease/phosphatase family metal-dependent hydrolase
VAFGEDSIAAPAAKTARRRRQCEAIARLVDAELRPDSPFLIVGDMNDTPDSEALQPLAQSAALELVDALMDPQETRPAKADTPAPPTKAWTHRFKETGQPASYELFDQIWLSPALQDNLSESWIDRRTKHSGDGSDHDPAWVVLDV